MAENCKKLGTPVNPCGLLPSMCTAKTSLTGTLLTGKLSEPASPTGSGQRITFGWSCSCLRTSAPSHWTQHNGTSGASYGSCKVEKATFPHLEERMKDARSWKKPPPQMLYQEGSPAILCVCVCFSAPPTWPIAFITGPWGPAAVISWGRGRGNRSSAFLRQCLIHSWICGREEREKEVRFHWIRLLVSAHFLHFFYTDVQPCLTLGTGIMQTG